MATYEYRCDEHGSVEVWAPVGTAPATHPCPTCRGDAVRVFSPPYVSRAPRGIVAAIDDAARTAEQPDVVTSIPRAGARRRTPTAPPHPALQRLPRP